MAAAAAADEDKVSASAQSSATDAESRPVACEELTSCSEEWPRMRERLLHSMAASAAREAAGSEQEPVLEPPSTPACAEVPNCLLHSGSPPGGDTCDGASAKHSPPLEQSEKWAHEEGSAACRPPVRWPSRGRGATVLLLLALLLLAFNRPAWKGSHLDVSLSVQFSPRGGSRLCQQCTGGCGRLRDDVPRGQDLMWTGQPMACRAGYCIPAVAPIEMTHACSGDWDSLEMEEAEEEQPDMDEGLGTRRGRRLLVTGSGRQLAHVGREQVRLLNRWTRAFATRIALENESPPAANTAPVTLASAEAPFADPFLMEFEDVGALRQAYNETPMTFEQALLAARLDVQKAGQGSLRSVVKAVAADTVLSNLLQDDPSIDASSSGSDGPVRKTARLRSAADEAPAEPAPATGVNRAAPIHSMSASAQTLKGINVKVMGVVQPALPNKLVPSAQKCFLLGYNQGYTNLSTPHYLAVKNTANKGACCSLCQRDSRCVAWTRVAGARDDVRTCYLKDSFQRDPDLAAFAYSYAPPYLHRDYPQVRYIVESQPVILESGTKQAVLPAELYGCPYPPVPGQPAGTCAAPDTCNCYQGICYGSCKGGLANEQRRR
ncbi:hypothetical protein COCOBI_05-6130 [Coccomyxa sp. Obi]|nr:hypothetical protein COCOBI_05-6130 [Coccomyxa sp. Obi]